MARRPLRGKICFSASAQPLFHPNKAQNVLQTFIYAYGLWSVLTLTRFKSFSSQIFKDNSTTQFKYLGVSRGFMVFPGHHLEFVYILQSRALNYKYTLMYDMYAQACRVYWDID